MMLASPSSADSLEAIQAAGVERRGNSGCPFCESMLARPCGPFYVEWDDCVNAVKGAPGGEDPQSGKSFVTVCAVFTKAMMVCMQSHPDEYPEMQQGSSDSSAKEADGEAASKSAPVEAAAAEEPATVTR